MRVVASSIALAAFSFFVPTSTFASVSAPVQPVPSQMVTLEARVATAVAPFAGNVPEQTAGTPGATPPAPTPTATPAPTATPVRPATAPSAAKLLAEARTAVAAANTSHFDLRERLSLLFLIAGTIRVQGDMSQRPSAVRAHLTGSLTELGKQQRLDEYHTQIGKRAWVKSAKTHHRWQKAQPTTSNGLAPIGNPLDVASGNGIQMLGLTTVGSRVFHGIPCWHIHGTVRAKVNKSRSAKGTVDFLISKQGSLPYQVREDVNDTKDGVTVHLRYRASQFGEKLSIAAPKVGSTSP